MHQLEHSKRFKNMKRFRQIEMDGIVKESAGKMMNSAVFGQIIILVVYLPIFTLEGIEGKMFKPMAQTVAFALIGAFILSLTYVPMMSAILLSKKVKSKPTVSDKLLGSLERFYQTYLEKILQRPKTIVVSVIALFVVALGVLTTLGGEFIPALEEGDFAVETRVLTGTSLKGSMEACLKAERILISNFPEVLKVVGKTGSGEIPTDPMPMEATDLMIILKDKKEWTSAKSFDELAVKMKKVLEDIPGVTFGFQYPVQMRFNELMTGARQDVVCKIYGEDLDTLAKYADHLGRIVNGISGAADLYVESVVGMPQIVIDYNRASLSQYGLTIEDVNRNINAAFSGQAAGLVYEGEKRFDLVIRMDKEQRTDVSDVQNLLISTPTGIQLPLSTVAKVSVIDGPNQIQRENTKRRIVIGFNARGRDVQSLVEELQLKTNAKIKFPPGYTVEYGGSFKNLEKAKQRLGVAVPLALLLIFILLYFAFKSVKQGLLIFTAIPLSAIGGIFALAILGLPFSISAGVGFIALFGVAVLNGIVLIAEFNRLKSEGMTDLKRIVLMGTKIRMRPVLMTAFVASLGFLPMAMSHGAGAEVQRPLASVVIGGLLLATLLTLFVLPVLYILFTKSTLKNGLVKPVSLMVLLFMVSNLNAQSSISFEAAIDTAVSNNLELKNQRYNAANQKELIATAKALAATNVIGEFGRLNSRYIDNRLSFSQSFDFPLVYTRKKQFLQQEWLKSVAQVELKQKELKSEVANSFFSYVNLNEKYQLLKKSDSIYGAYLQKAELRIRAGESSILEKITIENQRIQIANQLKQLNDALRYEELHFNFLLNTKSSYLPDVKIKKITVIGSMDPTSLAMHPKLKVLDAEIQSANAQVNLEKSKFYPSFSVGLISGTMYGFGADNNFYSYGSRFTAGQIGVSLPFFSKQGTNIKSSKINALIVQNNSILERNRIKNQLESAINQFKTQQQILEEYQSKALPNATLIFETAQKQFVNGEIDYLQWAMLINQSISIQSEYQDALMRYNELAIELNNLLQ